MFRTLASFSLIALLGGCSVSTLDTASDTGPENTCETDADCGGGVCDLERGICRATTGELGTVLVQITAPAQSGNYSLLSFLQTVEQLPSEGGALDLLVPEPGEIEAEVVPTADTSSGCVASYNESPTVPVKVRFRPTERVFGLAAADIDAETGEIAPGESYKFKARMAPGKYDVYVEPVQAAISGDACSVVPQVFRNFEVTSGDVDPSAPATPLYLSPPKTLKVIVDWPTEPAGNSEKSLEQWKVDVLDPATGWILSKPATLALDASLGEPGVQRYVATVEFSELAEAEVAGEELVRLSPPDPENGAPPVVAPTFVLPRWAVEGLNGGEAKIDHITSLPNPVQVNGAVFDGDGIQANQVVSELALRFVSKQLSLDGGATKGPTQGAPVYFSTQVPYIGGSYDVQLLPGEYDVYAIPTSSESNVAVTKTTLSVSPNAPVQAGKTIVIDPTTQLSGVAIGPNGVDPMADAKVRVIASPETPDPVWQALGLTPPKPLSVEGVVGKDGAFVVDVHPGTLDVSIRPDSASGFAWMVRPNVSVAEGAHELENVGMPLPVVYDGAVKVDADTTLPNALIQAYVFLNAQGYTDDRASAKAVVQVAETRADKLGNFRLLLPAHLN